MAEKIAVYPGTFDPMTLEHFDLIQRSAKLYWLVTLDRKWRIERGWKDFMRYPGFDCGRAPGNGMLTVAILGYLGIRQMEEIGRPWTLD